MCVGVCVCVCMTKGVYLRVMHRWTAWLPATLWMSQSCMLTTDTHASTQWRMCACVCRYVSHKMFMFRCTSERERMHGNINISIYALCVYYMRVHVCLFLNSMSNDDMHSLTKSLSCSHNEQANHACVVAVPRGVWKNACVCFNCDVYMSLVHENEYKWLNSR